MTGKVRKRGAPGRERGAVITEAAVCLPVFMFMMVILLSIAQMAYVEERIAVGTDAVAKQMAQYAHVFFAAGLDGVFSGEGGMSSEIADGIAEVLREIGEIAGADVLSEAGDAIASDSLTAVLEDGIGIALAERSLPGTVMCGAEDPDAAFAAFLARNRVSGLTFERSKILEGSSDDIFLWVEYDMKVVELLGIDVTFHLRHTARTTAWKGGVSLS